MVAMPYFRGQTQQELGCVIWCQQKWVSTWTPSIPSIKKKSLVPCMLLHQACRNKQPLISPALALILNPSSQR